MDKQRYSVKRLFLIAGIVAVSVIFSLHAAAAPIKLEEAFPDPALRNIVGDSYSDRDADGYLSDEELKHITYLELGSDIKSLEGLKYLKYVTHLTLDKTSARESTLDLRGLSSLRFLDVKNNGFTQIDLSQNAALETLDIENEKFRVIDLSGKKNVWEANITECPIVEVNAENASKLRDLTIDNSVYGAMEKLNVSGCTSLETLYIIKAYFTTLDLGTLPKLRELTVSDFPDLAKLNLSGLPNLSNLDLTRCDKLAKVDLSSNTKLETFNIYDCYYLSGLDLSKNKSVHLSLYRTNPLKEMVKAGKKNIVSLIVQNCTVDKSLDMKSYTGLADFGIYDCKGLSSVDVSGTKVTSLRIRSDYIKELTVKGSKSFDADYGLILTCPNLKTLNLENVKQIIGWNGSSGGSDEDDRIDGTLDECEKLKKLVFKGNAPKFDSNAFRVLNGTTVYYPYGYASWKAGVRKDYDGKNITWIAYDQTTGKAVKNPNKDNVLKAGDTYKDTVNGGVYKVKKEKKKLTLTLTGVVQKSAAKLIVPTTITVGSTKYKVTAIASGACKGNKKLKTVDIGAAVKTIGKKAFYGCKALKNITIRTKYLTSTTVGAKAFKGTASKATVKVPKAKLSAYKKLLKKKGIGSKAKFKKLK